MLERFRTQYVEIGHLVEERCFLQTLKRIEKIGIDHRFVGGIVTDLLTPEAVKQAQIDVQNRTIHLPVHAPLNPRRKDGTSKDIDIITFISDKEVYEAGHEQVMHRSVGP